MRKKKPVIFHYRAPAAITGLLISISGILVLIGWVYNIEPLKNFGLGTVRMKPFTGLCFALIGLSISLLYSRNKWLIFVSRAIALVITLIGLFSILEFILHINFGIEDFILGNYAYPRPFPGMLSFNTSLCIILSGIFILFLSTRPNKFSYPAAFILVIIFSVGFIGFVGSIIGFSNYSEYTGFHNMSVLTSILLMLVSIGSLMYYLAYCALRISIEQKFYSTAVFILTIIAFITLLTNKEFKSLREANFSVEKNRVVKTKLNAAVSQVLEIETAIRGFLLSNNEDYLQFVERAKSDVTTNFKDLKMMLADDPAQIVRLDTLKSLIEKRIDHAIFILDVSRREGIDTGIKLFKTNKGKKLTDEIRALAEQMIIIENNKITENNKLAEVRSFKTLSFIFINLAIEVLILSVFFVFLGKNIRKRKEAVDEIILLNQKLDEMVRQRTSELMVSEAKYRDIVESSLVGVFSRSLHGIMLYSNEAFAKILEFDKASDIMGSSSHNFYLNHDARRAFLDKLQADGFVKNFESDLVTAKGNIKTVEVTAKLRENIITGMMYDITDRKKAELALSESEAKLRLIMENSADAIGIINLRGEFIFANLTASKMMGYPLEEIIGKTIADITPSQHKEDINSQILKLLNQGKLFTEWTLLKKDNSVITAEVNAVVLPDGNIYGSLRDITLRKKEQEELERHRNNLEEQVEERTKEVKAYLKEIEDLYDNAPCGYYSLDSNGVIVRINDTELKWLGYKKGEVLEMMRIEDFLTPESQKKYMEDFRALIKTGSMINKEYEYKRKDGSTFTGMTNATALYDSEKNFLISRSMLTDITELKHYENALKDAKREAEDASKVKSEFLANMSHEIRTPMNAVLGYTELLCSTSLDQIQKGYVSSIITSGKNLLTLINDILDLSKIEAGKFNLENNYIDTGAFFSEFENIFTLRLAEKGLKFILNISSGTPNGLYLDETRLRQVMLNLLGNAIKFTNNGSITVTVMAENPTTAASPEEREEYLIDLIIKVEDTGIGISKKMQKSIFEPFVQEHDFRHFGGTGLGLAITQRLIKLMNGSISVESQENKGSIFTITIPRTPYLTEFVKPIAEYDFNPDEIVFEKAVILVADDVEHNRNYLHDALQRTNLRIVDATNGQEAYDIARKIIPDLIITDIVMPEMDGFQLLNKIKKNKNLKHIPVIAYSASVLKEKKEKISRSEFAGLLAKPVQLSQLYSSLMNILPYRKEKGENRENEFPEYAQKEELKDPLTLIISLETTFYSSWKSFTVRQPIKEITEFGISIEQLGKDHNSVLVEQYGKDLITAAKNFNIQGILNLINIYPAMTERIKNMAKNDGGAK